MKLIHLGMVSTGTIIVLGMAMVVPAFTQHSPDKSIPSVMLSFVVLDDANASGWCAGLSSLLEKHDVKGTVFVSGKTAQASPECVTSFSSDVDIGSQTYSYADLTSTDYAKAFEEVKRGKEAVDGAGNLDSKLFRASYGRTDENIYSLAGRSGIIADFSYNNRYHKYEGDQFVRYDLKTITGDSEGLRLFSIVVADDDAVRPLLPVPIAITFNSAMQLEHIEEFISELESGYGDSIHFVNASDLAGTDLTIRAGEQST